MDSADFLAKCLTANNHDLSSAEQQNILHYLNLMTDWDRVYNLTAIKGLHDKIMLHILDSLSIRRFLKGTEIIDVGSGAGLPGIPLAIAEPKRSFVLVDSNSKKTAFLLQVKAELQLANVEIIHQRVEHFHPVKTFDSILTRAFSSLQVMLQAVSALGNEESLFLAMKGKLSAEEQQNMPPGFEIVGLDQLSIAGLDAERHLISIKKRAAPSPK